MRRVCILVKGFTRDAWMRLKLIRETWILMKGERDSWIYEPKWDVICLLIYTWPINFFFHFVKTSRFPRNIRTETWRFPFSKREAGIFPKHSCAKHDQGLHFAAGQIWRTYIQQKIYLHSTIKQSIKLFNCAQMKIFV